MNALMTLDSAGNKKDLFIISAQSGLPKTVIAAWAKSLFILYHLSHSTLFENHYLQAKSFSSLDMTFADFPSNRFLNSLGLDEPLC